ncbi:MAG: TonB-dependent receptor domain-containing protein [Bacteroidales bacterium]|jgi:outer membrane cobalamin receptor
MKFRLFVILVLIILFDLEIGAQNIDSIFYDLDIEEVVIRRKPMLPITDIGPLKSTADSTLLFESISVNLGDILSGFGSIFVKSYGRSTLSTASFRGTSSYHTQVLWNGMKINSPMLGMVDLSTIPSFLIDKMDVSSGSSTVGVVSGGIGGSIELETGTEADDSSFNILYVQGISSYSTYDQYLKLSYGGDKLKSSTKLFFTSSKNDFSFTNYRKKIFLFDDHGNTIESHHPVEKNRNGFFKDLHLLHEFGWDSDDGSHWGASLWFMNSHRGVPMLNVDYRTVSSSENFKDETSIKSTFLWNRDQKRIKHSLRGGYNYSDLKYVYLGDTGYGSLKKMIDSNSAINTLFISGDTEFRPDNNLTISISVSLYHHFVKSFDRARANITTGNSVIGYKKSRFEPSVTMTAKYRPTNRLGISAIVREDVYGKSVVPPVPAVFVDFLLSEKLGIKVKSSFARNFRFPTLNDLYFNPGGNPGLKPEKGFTYDLGASYNIKNKTFSLGGNLLVFGSKIDDWILWLPTYKGYWTPYNIRRVDSRGLETTTELILNFSEQKALTVEGNFAVTRSINKGDPVGLLDESIGKQLVYIPLYSSSIKGIFDAKKWKFVYSWNYYSKRYTTSNNDEGSTLGQLGDYFMNDISLERDFYLKIGSLSVKIMVNNLFNEEYESVLNRPMPGRNYGLFLSLKSFL